MLSEFVALVLSAIGIGFVVNTGRRFHVLSEEAVLLRFVVALIFMNLSVIVKKAQVVDNNVIHVVSLIFVVGMGFRLTRLAAQRSSTQTKPDSKPKS